MENPNFEFEAGYLAPLLLSKLDTDGDGAVSWADFEQCFGHASKAELDEVATSLGPLSEATRVGLLKRIFQALNQSRSGLLSYGEVLAWVQLEASMQECKPQDPDQAAAWEQTMAWEVFAVMDTDKVGTADLAGMSYYFREHGIRELRRAAQDVLAFDAVRRQRERVVELEAERLVLEELAPSVAMSSGKQEDTPRQALEAVGAGAKEKTAGKKKGWFRKFKQKPKQEDIPCSEGGKALVGGAERPKKVAEGAEQLQAKVCRRLCVQCRGHAKRHLRLTPGLTPKSVLGGQGLGEEQGDLRANSAPVESIGDSGRSEPTAGAAGEDREESKQDEEREDEAEANNVLRPCTCGPAAASTEPDLCEGCDGLVCAQCRRALASRGCGCRPRGLGVQHARTGYFRWQNGEQRVGAGGGETLAVLLLPDDADDGMDSDDDPVWPWMQPSPGSTSQRGRHGFSNGKDEELNPAAPAHTHPRSRTHTPPAGGTIVLDPDDPRYWGNSQAMRALRLQQQHRLQQQQQQQQARKGSARTAET